ncbi:hypothetical protein EVAR_48403_1 [Eumeta japonica]|uniref:Uncharacterized protein n=1 Tax=Eumeta variegata TaxID=151549 RepID=A0A4C1XRU2_EUMVA|nr:hypothetical protein EVAR_48403_1 [Eumeta japonica]
MQTALAARVVGTKRALKARPPLRALPSLKRLRSPYADANGGGGRFDRSVRITMHKLEHHAGNSAERSSAGVSK